MIQIASMVTEQGSAKPLVRNVMTLGTCAPIVGAEVMSFASEEELLKVRASCLTVRPSRRVYSCRVLLRMCLSPDLCRLLCAL